MQLNNCAYSAYGSGVCFCSGCSSFLASPALVCCFHFLPYTTNIFAGIVVNNNCKKNAMPVWLGQEMKYTMWKVSYEANFKLKGEFMLKAKETDRL